MLRFMLGLISPPVPEEGVQVFTPDEAAKYTARQEKYLDQETVGSVNKAPFATFAAKSSGFSFIHTHPLASDENMVERKEDIDASLLTTNVMLGKDGKPVETAKMSRRFHEAITGQTELDPNQGNVFEFAMFTKEEFEAATGGGKYRAHPNAAQIVAEAGGHEAIKALLRNPKVGDIVFVGKDARTQFFDVIVPEMSDLKIILFGESTARLAFPKMGMHAFSFMRPESTAFGIMFYEKTGVWRNFMCVHGYGTLNGYTVTSQGEAGMANNMRALVRIADWFHYIHMQPICENFEDSPIWKRHIEALVNYAVDEENTMQQCFVNKEPYISPPLRMSRKGSRKGAETLRKQPATGTYRGVVMKNQQTCDNALQESGKEMAERELARPATGKHRGVVMKNKKTCDNALQEKGKKLGEKHGGKKHSDRKFDLVRVRVWRVTSEGAIEVIADFNGSFREKHQGGISSASVCIQRSRVNDEQYALMLEKFDEERDRFENAVGIGKSTLSLNFAHPS